MKTNSKNNKPASGPRGVLCGTDFSPAVVQTANVAAALARRLQTSLELAHASVVPAVPELREKLDAEAERLRQQGTGVRASLLNVPAAES